MHFGILLFHLIVIVFIPLKTIFRNLADCLTELIMRCVSKSNLSDLANDQGEVP